MRRPSARGLCIQASQASRDTSCVCSQSSSFVCACFIRHRLVAAQGRPPVLHKARKTQRLRWPDTGYNNFTGQTHSAFLRCCTACHVVTPVASSLPRLSSLHTTARNNGGSGSFSERARRRHRDRIASYKQPGLPSLPCASLFGLVLIYWLTCGNHNLSVLRNGCETSSHSP